jgi:hypothetical protein
MSTYELFGTRNGPFYVADTSKRVRLHGRPLTRYPMSRLYDQRCDAVAVQDWLAERAAGYPPKQLPWPAE